MILSITDNRVAIQEFGMGIILITLAQLEELTGSQRLMKIIRKIPAGKTETIIIRRNRTKLEIMHGEFKEQQIYRNLHTNWNYRCVKVDKHTGEGVFRNTSNRKELLSSYEVDSWEIVG